MKPIKVITYGRSSKNSKSFPYDNKMSRIHCQIIQYDNDTYEIIDLGSTNGTWINGQMIQANSSYSLRPTDVIRIGETTLRWMKDFDGPKEPPISDDDDNEKNHNLSLVILFSGLLSIGLVGYIIISYFTSFGQAMASTFGGVEGTVKLFPIYLHGYFGVGGQWLPMIAAIVIGVVADLIDSFNDTDDNLASIGQWLANAGITIASIFLLLAILAPTIVKLY